MFVTEHKVLMEKLTFLIPFRRGSKGLPHKNITNIAGEPLYWKTVEQALLFPDSDIFVSTDYRKSELMLWDRKVHYIRREAMLCSDETTMEEVVLDFIKNNLPSPSNIVLLQVSSPLRTLGDITEAINLYLENDYDLVFSVTSAPSQVLKYGFLDGNGQFDSINKPEYCFYNRQRLPKLFRPNGMVYVFNSEWLLQNGGFSTSNVGSTFVPSHRSIDIDEHKDLIAVKEYIEGDK